MERRITEEEVTKAILGWLEENNWKIVCFDFPQSGTGISLHPNEEMRSTKNAGAFIPDIVAIRKGIVVFFENKDRFVIGDFRKVKELRGTPDYSNAIVRLLGQWKLLKIFYGVGFVYSDLLEKKYLDHFDMVDFVVGYFGNGMIRVRFDPKGIFM